LTHTYFDTINDKVNGLDKKEQALVNSIAHKLYNKYFSEARPGHYTLEDLFHYGIIGLLKAQKRFDATRDVPFTAYARIRIQGEILDAIRKSFTVNIPQEKYKMVRQLSEAKMALEKNGEPGQLDDLSSYLGWDQETLLKAEGYSHNDSSIDEEDDCRELSDKEEHIETNLLSRDLSEALDGCLKAISNPTKRLVLVSRKLQEMTLAQLAGNLGCSIETVRRHEISAMESMKPCMKNKGWDLS